jgi:ligand-binding sensor domain-containing protein
MIAGRGIVRMIMPGFQAKRSEFMTWCWAANGPARFVVLQCHGLWNRRNLLRTVGLLLLVVAVSHRAAADGVVAPTLNPELAIHQYARRSWWVGDGLPSNRVLDILQTRDGYLWVATDRGLARFDGVRFTTWDSSNTAELTTDEIRRLYETRDGTLWVGTRRGLLRFPAGNPPRGQAVTEFGESTIQSLLEDQNGTLWVGTETGTWKSRTDEFVLIEEAPKKVLTIAETADGVVWFGGPAGASRLDAGKFTAMT